MNNLNFCTGILTKGLIILGVILNVQSGFSCTCSNGFEPDFYMNITTQTKQCLVVYEGKEMNYIPGTEVGRFRLIDKLSYFDQNIGDLVYSYGADGGNCNEELSRFSVNDTLFLILADYWIDTNNLDTFTLNGTCGKHFLRVVDGKNNNMSISEISDLIIGISGSEDIVESDKGLKMYPNPTNDMVNIRVIDKRIYGYKLFDVLGKLIKTEQNIQQSSINIDLSTQSCGSYFIWLNTDDIWSSHMVMKN